MHKVLRFTALAILAASGLTACGDKVTNINTPPTTTTTPTTNVQSVVVTPSAVSLQQGQTVQLVAVVTADAGVARTVTWSSSATSVATVDNTGKVTAVAAGTAVIIATSTADAGKQGTSAITVAGTTNPSLTISTISQSGVPANLSSVAGQLDVTLNVDPGSTFIKTINLFLNCGAGDVLVATQTVSDKAPMTGPAGATQPVTLSFNTADTTSAGVPKFKNGSCTVKGQLITTTGSTFNSTNSVSLTLANVSTFTVAVTAAGDHAGFPATGISTIDGLLRYQGNVTLTLKALNYASGAPLASINGSFMGRAFTATPNAGTQTFVVAFADDSAKTLGYGVCTASCLGIYQYATAAATGEVVTVSSSIDSLGNQGFPTPPAVFTSNTGFRVDNQSPNTPSSKVVNANAGSQQWLNAGYTFVGTGKYKSNATPDAIMGATTVKIGYMSAASFTPLVGTTTAAGASAVGDSLCSTAGFTLVTAASAIPTSTTDNVYSSRAFEYDPMGNVTCTDLTVSNGGTAANTLAYGVDNKLPIAAFASTSVGTNKADITAAGHNFAFTYSDTGSGFNPDSAMRATIIRNYATTFATATDCVFGAYDAVKKTCSVKGFNTSLAVDNGAGGNGYYTISGFAQDQAGNQSTPTLTRTFAVDAGPVAVGAVTQVSPAKVDSLNAAGGSFSALATDPLDLNTYVGLTTYAGMPSFLGSSGSFGTTFDATFVQSATATATLSTVFRYMQPTDATTGQILAGGVTPGASITATNVANATINPVAPAGTAATGTGAITIAGTTPTDTLVVAGDSMKVHHGCTTAPCNLSIAGATAGAPTSRTLTLTFNGLTASFPNSPFANVYFYAQDKNTGAAFLLGTQNQPNVTDTGGAGSIRTFTWTLGTGLTVPAGYANGDTFNVYAVGMTADGHAFVAQTSATGTPLISVVK